MKRILVVDDEANIVELLRLYLEKEGFAVIAARDGDEASALHLRHDPDLVILDLMPAEEGRVRRLPRDPSARRDPDPHAHGPVGRRGLIVGLELGADDLRHQAVNPRALVAAGEGDPRRTTATASGARPTRSANCGSMPVA